MPNPSSEPSIRSTLRRRRQTTINIKPDPAGEIPPAPRPRLPEPISRVALIDPKTYLKSPALIVDTKRSPVESRPLTTEAHQIYYSFCKRLIFWDQCWYSDAPVDMVGPELLGVQKAQAGKILHELQTIGGPINWFRRNVMLGMHKGKIGRGHEIKASKFADNFFAQLVRTNDGLEESPFCDAMNEMKSSRVCDLDAVTRHMEGYEREVAYYRVYSNFLWRDED